MDGVVVETIDEVTRAVAITVEPSEFRAKYNKELSKAASKASIRGFRAGKVPKNIVEQRFGAEIRKDVIDGLLSEAVTGVVSAHALELAGRPVVDELKDSEEGLTARVTLSLTPRPDLSDLESCLAALTVTPPTADRSALVDELLERYRYQLSTLVPVEGRTTAEVGDVVRFRRVEIDENGEEVEGTASSDRHRLRSIESIRATPQLSSPVEEKFVTTFLGKALGEQWEDSVTPAKPQEQVEDAAVAQGDGSTVAAAEEDGDEGAEKQAPQTSRYRYTCEELLRPSSSDWSDPKIKELLNGEEVSDVRKRAEAEIDERLSAEREQVMVDQVLAALSERYQFKIPQLLINEQIRLLMRRAFRIDDAVPLPDSFLKSDIAKVFEEPAVKSLRVDILLDRIAEGEGLSISTPDQFSEWAKTRAIRAFGNDAVSMLRSINSRESFEVGLMLANRDIARQHLYAKITGSNESTAQEVASNE